MDYVAGVFNLVVDNAPNLIGFILPPFVAIINKDVKKDYERYIVSLFVCFLVAVVLHWKEIAYGTPEEAFTYFGIIFVESQTIYRLYFKDSWLYQKMQKTVL